MLFVLGFLNLKPSKLAFQIQFYNALLAGCDSCELMFCELSDLSF